MPDPTTRIEAADAGGAVRVDRGTRLVVELEENPTTGYRWAVVAGAEDILDAGGSAFTPGAGAPGAAGLRTFTFVANGAGAALLRLELRRPWEDAVQQSFEVRVEVS